MDKLTHWDYQIRATDLAIEAWLKRQNLDTGNPLYGAGEVPARGYWGGENGTGIARLFLTSYYLKGSKYYLDPLMLNRSEKAIRFTLRQQKEDGTFDLKETNLHDGAQTSFHMTSLGPAGPPRQRDFPRVRTGQLYRGGRHPEKERQEV